MKEKLCWILGPGDRVMISGHQLHAALGCEMPYQEWFIRQLQCGYKSGEDFIFNDRYSHTPMGDGVTRYEVDHLLSVHMARSICAHQQDDAGRFYWQYLRPVAGETERTYAMLAIAYQEFFDRAIGLDEKSQLLEDELEETRRQLADAQNKLDYSQWVIDHPAAMAITRIAGLYGWTPNQMNCWLEKQRIQYRSGKSWFLYPGHAKAGYTHAERHSKRDGSGKVWPQIRQLWTQKGRMFIYELMKKEGNLPQYDKDREDSGNV